MAPKTKKASQAATAPASAGSVSQADQDFFSAENILAVAKHIDAADKEFFTHKVSRREAEKLLGRRIVKGTPMEAAVLEYLENFYGISWSELQNDKQAMRHTVKCEVDKVDPQMWATTSAPASAGSSEADSEEAP